MSGRELIDYILDDTGQVSKGKSSRKLIRSMDLMKIWIYALDLPPDCVEFHTIRGFIKWRVGERADSLDAFNYALKCKEKQYTYPFDIYERIRDLQKTIAAEHTIDTYGG